jgi:ABC-type branched-subunit amino acid transport system substrate-binding protein
MTKAGTRVLVASVVLAVSFMMLCATLSSSAMAQTKTVKIGLITSVTGPMAPGFRPILEAAKPAEELMNQRGGITVKGQKYNIEIVTTDDQSAPAGAVSATNKLLQADVKLVIAPIFIPNFMASGPISEEAKVLRILPASIDPLLFGAPNRYSFDGEATHYGAPYVYDKLKSIFPKLKRVAIIRPDDPGFKFPDEYTVKEIEKRGMEVVAHEVFKMPTDDFYPILTKVLAHKPDSIELLSSILPFAKGVIEQARELGFTGPITSVAHVADVNQLKNALNPKVAYDLYLAGPDVMSPKMPAMIRDYKKLVEKGSKDKMDFVHVLALQALWIIVQGVEKAQSFDADQIAAALESMPQIETPYGPGKMVGKDLVGANRLLLKNVPFTRILKGGKMEFEFLPVKYN